MSETKWNKKINLQPEIKEETFQEGFAETSLQRQRSWCDSPDKGAVAPVLDEMMQKLTDMRNKKKGFTKLPFLESIYGDPVIREGLDAAAEAAANIGADADAAKASVADTAKASAAATIAAASEIDPDKGAQEYVKDVEKLTTTKKYQDFIQYVANLSYNISFDVFAYGIFQIANGKQPEDPGKEPKLKKKPTPEDTAKYNREKKQYEAKKPDYDDKKLIAHMYNRILTCLISLFITYNLYFSYSTPKEPNKKTAFDSIEEWIEMLPTPFFPLKCAITPVREFLKFLAWIHWVMQMVPFQPLLFAMSMFLAFTFIHSGLARKFINMGVSVLDPVGTYGKTKNSLGFATQNPDDIIIVTIVLLCVIRNVIHVCWHFKRPEVIVNIVALFLWLMVFGLSLLFIPIGKFAISLIMFYVCMFSMTSSKENGINIFQTVMDLDEKLQGKHVAYECSDANTFKGIMERFSKFIGSWILNNIYLLTLLPIANGNIQNSASISEKNKNVRSFSNFLCAILILIVFTSNKYFVMATSWFMSKLMKEIKVVDTTTPLGDDINPIIDNFKSVTSSGVDTTSSDKKTQ